MPPFESIETRWFFEGDSSLHSELRSWFESCAPFRRAADVRAPEWTGRAGGEPDVYLLMPGCTDMGVKWREGMLQIKGRVADLGTRNFGARHRGRVQRWIKWTYAEVPAAYRALFDVNGSLQTAAVHKTRALRMISLDSARPEEVAPDSTLERGVGFEMTDLELHGERYCSVAFEAFPGDEESEAGFDTVVERVLGELEIPLGVGISLSYPDWLYR
ncbi:MAG TPA: hypothetical protein VK854_13550 [Woeseiaceae bacterium]|nr:hypothetical protein [Woeseiaceae bacterium]